MVYTMRSKVLLLLLLCFCFEACVGNIIHRQDRPTNPPTTDSPSATTSSNQPEQTESSQTESSGRDGKESISIDRSKSTFATLTPTANSTSSSTSATATSAATTAVISNINGASPTSSLNPSTYNSTLTPNKLPLTPEVTPAFGVAGVILMLSGVVYTLIGMKNTFLHVYLSAAYLSSLAVTVLILYVMNPPVSDAIQGAYLVAIVMTGLILGGAAIVFTEMTEGLGSLLGGFCFSMWLLVLKPGGLLTSTSSKAIFIAAFTVAAFSTSFSHYTRPYGVIGGISFGGATAVVIGIDCFSRAGLKEFWAYLWDLNSNLFPLGATTYPLTRGMKVEIAAIIIIFLAGIVSQMKLWKVIKERREQRASERLQDERTMEQEEENVGRRVEHATAEDRSQWEAVYGNKEGEKAVGRSIRDSGVGDMDSQKKGPRSEVTSVRRSDEEIEMSDMPTPAPPGLVMPSQGQEGGQITVRVARDPETPQLLDENGNPIDSDPNGRSYSSVPGSTQMSLDSDKIWVVGADGEARLERRPSKRDSKRVSGSVAPEVVPLPFKVPEGDVEDDRSSVATFADDEEGFQKRRSKHLSVGSMLMRKLSGKSAKSAKSNRNSKSFTSGEGMSTDDLVIPRGIEDDRASSIAATMDGLSDDDMRSVRSSFDNGPDTTDSARLEDSPVLSPAEDETPVMKDQGLATPEDKSTTRPVSAATVATDILEPATGPQEISEDQIAAKRRSLTSSTNPKPDPQSVPDKELDNIEKPAVVPSVISAVESKPASITKDRLPPQLSKVVMSYRTNEWAKHLSSADAPEMDELKLAEYPVEEETKAELAAPVNVEELQQTAEIAVPRPASRSASQMSNYGPPVLTRSTSSLSRAPPQVGPPRDNHFPPQTQDNNLNRSASQLSLKSQNVPRGFRSPSGALIPEQIVESPIEEDLPSRSPGMQSNGKFQNAIPFGPSTTLLGKRDSMLRNKTSYSANHAALASTPEFPPTTQSASRATSEAGSLYNYPNSNAIVDDDEMPLSVRRNMIRRSSIQAEQPPAQPVLYDSHQPKRQSSAPHPMVREQQLASWRASVQQDLKSTVVPKNTIERSRSALWQERQAEEQKRMMEERKKGERDSKFDERMRRGDMLDAHREALRRMQASANKHA
ncbi:hypothetical protein ONS95_009519 [Cadophora gregata]|uniref:uncharacterized protein n=1 Tax=Cadophora gregata TaxID=51156 RepID=UPI0026DAF422|nr:uncharacterized protein ONS95_009519 [Cadophora gregata]KAK0124570.1 hypothetical protein ONS95_009519 [Cadophora gregata]KAK0129575.1 hypothetical protein ONS96_000140 [Cadophora gregata f. sp. sojae]